jgi:hypothetical protein
MRGNEKFVRKRGVYILLHYEGKKLYNMAEAGKLKTKREMGMWRGAHASYARKRERISFVVDMPRKAEVERGAFEKQTATRQ